MASLFALKLARVEEGPATGVRAQDSRPRKARNQPVTIVEKRLDLFARNVDVVGVSDVDVGGAEDADGVHRNEDVSISGGCQPVHHRGCDAAIHDQHRAFPRAHAQRRTAERGDLASPGAGRVDQDLAADGSSFRGPPVLKLDALNRPVSCPHHADEGLIPHRLRSMLSGRSQVGFDQLPGLEGGILHGVGGTDIPIQHGLGREQPVERHRLDQDARCGARVGKCRQVVVWITRGCDEVATGELQAAWGDATEDHVLARAIACRAQVADHVPPARMQKPVIPTARAGGEVRALHQQRAEASHREIAQHA